MEAHPTNKPKEEVTGETSESRVIGEQEVELMDHNGFVGYIKSLTGIRYQLLPSWQRKDSPSVLW